MTQIIKKPRTHMSIPWEDYILSGDDVRAVDAAISEKASVVGRVGLAMIKCGTPAWRTRQAMVSIARDLGIVCVTDIGISTLNFTCMEKHKSYTMALSVEGIAVNTHRLYKMYEFIEELKVDCQSLSIGQIHKKMDDMKNEAAGHSMLTLVLAAAIACSALALVIGAGWPVVICVFLSAAAGQFIRKLLSNHGVSIFIGIAASAAAAAAVYALMAYLARFVPAVGEIAGPGYICAILFLVPGFPFITSILDFAKLDMRSGIERLSYASIVMLMATVIAQAAAFFAGFGTETLSGISLSGVWLIAVWAAASFLSISCFSLMFNSSFKMAILAGIAGMFPNTLRLVLVKSCGVPATLAAFIMAVLAGLLAYLFVILTGYPRVAITVPSVVVAVPGYLIYEAVYNFGNHNYTDGLGALIKAAGIILALGLGVLAARFITDRQFRHKD